MRGNFRKARDDKLNGQEALDVVRIRKNRCAPEESDLTRARRQQKFLEAVKGRIFSPFTLPALAVGGLACAEGDPVRHGRPAADGALSSTSETGGDIKPAILRPIDPGANPLVVSDGRETGRGREGSWTGSRG